MKRHVYKKIGLYINSLPSSTNMPNAVIRILSCVPLFRGPPSSLMATMSARHIFILVLMVYVCVLNILLVNSLFRNYLQDNTPKVETLAKKPWRAVAQTAPSHLAATQPLHVDAPNVNSEACLESHNARDNEVLCLAQRLPNARRCPVLSCYAQFQYRFNHKFS